MYLDVYAIRAHVEQRYCNVVLAYQKYKPSSVAPSAPQLVAVGADVSGL